MKFNVQFSRHTSIQKVFFVFCLGIVLGWGYDYFYSPVCHVLVFSGKNLEYTPDYLGIYVNVIFFVLGAVSIGVLLWVLEKNVNNKKHVSFNSPLDEELTSKEVRVIHFIDKFVWGGICLFLICTISLACERLF